MEKHDLFINKRIILCIMVTYTKQGNLEHTVTTVNHKEGITTSRDE